jgi:hypothetical protein
LSPRRQLSKEPTTVRIAFVLFFLLASSATAAVAQVPMLGGKYSGNLTIDDRTIPLLDGEWTVVARGEHKSTSGETAIDRVYLAQMNGNRLARWLYVSTNRDWNKGGWNRNKDVCDRKDVHVGSSDSNHSVQDAACWILEHVGLTLGKDPPQSAIDFYRWSDSRGRPNTALALHYFFAKRGDFLVAKYYFNPVVAGFPDTPTAVWQGSPWHPDLASKDEKKLAYLRQLKATGETLFDKLKTVLK